MEGHPGHDEAAPVTIGGSSGNITTSRSSMSMSMDMTFTNWSTSSLTLLLTSYKITKPWQFFLTWLAVFLATILTHVIRFAICSLDCAIANSVKSNPCHKGTYGPAGPGDASTFQTSKRIARPNGWLVLKLLHGLMTGCNYGLSLILMLVAMSMNPSLILALCLGYAAGDIIMAEHNFDLQTGSSGVIGKMYSWWTKHSYPEHFALIAGIITFPLSILVTYALIDTVCSPYRYGKASADMAPFPGSWVTDWCDFDIEPTQKKSLQISLAVFYSWLVVVAGMCLFSNSNKRVFRFMHTRQSLLGITNGETILFFGVASLLIFNCVYWHHTFTYLLDNSKLYTSWMGRSIRRPTYFATQVTGRLLDVSLGLLMLPVSKNSVLQLLLGISYTGAIGFHKCMGWFFVIVSAIHVSVYVKSASLDSLTSVTSHMFNMVEHHHEGTGHAEVSKNAWGIGNWMAAMGTIGTIIMVPPILLSVPYVRNKFYNLFYYSHLLFHVAIVFLWLHASSDLYYMMPAIGLYACDILLRTLARFSPHQVLKVTPTCGGLVRVDFDISERQSVRNFMPGQFIRVCFPSVNSFEWHPFTLAGQVGSPIGTIYMDPKMANVSSIPKQLAWSRAVCSKLQRENPISVEGPFGGISFDPRDVQTVICLVGGSGLTVGLSVSQYVDSADTVKENHKSVDMGAERIATTVAMLWSVNTTEDPIKLSSVFSDLSERTTVSVHRTTNNTEVECGIVLAAARGVDTTRGRETGTAVVTVVDGRVNFIDYLSQYSNAGDVGIVICGPPSFTTYALIASESFAQQRKDKVLLSVESFCL